MNRERGRPAGTERKPTEFGAWLRARRESLGWSSEQAAERFGLSQSMVSLYERGTRHPKRETAVTIGEALGDVEGSLKAAGFASLLGEEDTALLQSILALSLEDREHIRAIVERLARSSPESRSAGQ